MKKYFSSALDGWRWLWLAFVLGLVVSARGQTTAFTYDAPGHLTARTAVSPGVPLIVSSPMSVVLSEDGNVRFAVSASGTAPLTYQWLSNGVPISGATGDILAIPNVIVPRTVVSNGSFELPQVLVPYLTYLASSNFYGWQIETGSVDHVFTSTWIAADGFQSVDLNGTTGGAIFQDVPTTNGQQYFLRYALAGNPAAGPTFKTNVVWWNGAALGSNAFNITGHSYDELGWTNYEYIVTATSNLTRLKFASLSFGNAGPVLDDVSLIPVPPAPVQYSVIASNASGSVTSAVATIEFDTDKNGLPDSWERTYFVGPGQSPTADSDGDGVSNLDEYREGTNPTNSAAFRPRLNITAWPGGGASVQPMRSSYTLNESVQLTAQPQVGASFIGWTGSITNTNPVVNLVMNATKNLNTVFGYNLIPGTNSDGTIDPDGTNTYAFTANTGDTIVLRCGELSGSVSFAPWLRLYGPGSVLLSSLANASDAYIAYRATNSGLFSVTVSTTGSGQSGDYRLRFMRIPAAYVVPAGDQGGALTNGGNYAGTNDLGDEDLYTFTANANDSFVLRCGDTSGGASYLPWLRVYGPDGALLISDQDGTDSFISYRATNSGTFSVVVGSYNAGYTGSYLLRFAQMPGAFIIPPGDEGGALVNGGNHDGTNDLGDEDMWSFTANTGDNIVLRCGELSGTASYNPWIRIYGPTGALLAQNNNVADAFLAYQTTNSGTFAVLMGSAVAGTTGSYRLRFMQMPGAPIVPPGDEGGPLTNGGNHDGTTDMGDEDTWTFTANASENVILRCGELSGTPGYTPWIRVYGPTGALLAQNNDPADAWLAYQTTNSGTFTVLIGSAVVGNTGTYRLRFVKLPGTFVTPPGDEGGVLTNGAAHDGITSIGDEDIWSLSANAGDTIVLRCADLSGNVSYYPYLRIYGTNGALLAADTDQSDARITYRATNSGTFTVLVGSYYQGYTGNYRLRLAQVPGAFVIPAGDEGGTLANGGNHDGTNDLGDEDIWTFNANAGDSVVLRCADLSVGVSYYPYLRLYGPTGALLVEDTEQSDAFISYRTTNSGPFTVLVGSYYQGYTGNYRLRFMQIPGAFTVPGGDEGGTIAAGVTNNATTELADEDIWQLTAFKSVPITLNCQRLSATNSFTPWIRLYGPTGILLSSVANATLATISLTPTNTGPHTLLVGSFNRSGNGTYRLYGSGGFTEGLKLGTPNIAGTELTVLLTGGYSNLQFVVSAATNLAPPAASWTPILTNRFDAAGKFNVTNAYNATQPEKFFRIFLP